LSAITTSSATTSAYSVTRRTVAPASIRSTLDRSETSTPSRSITSFMPRASFAGFTMA
jgi:hypothetical protein